MFHIYVYEFGDNHAYIGQTCRLKKRRYSHLKGGPVFNHLQLTLGCEYRIIQSGIPTANEAIRLERIWIHHYLKLGWKLLNVDYSGTGARGPVIWSSEAKARFKASPARKAPKPWARGVKLTEERKKKISDALKGRKYSPQRCRNISNGQKGKVVTAQHRANLQTASRRRWNRASKRS